MTRMNQPPREHNSDPAEGIRQSEVLAEPDPGSAPGTGDKQPTRSALDPDQRPHADTAAEGE